MIGWLLVPVALLVTLAWQLIAWAEFSPRRTAPLRGARLFDPADVDRVAAERGGAA